MAATYVLWRFVSDRYMTGKGMQFVELERHGEDVTILHFRLKYGGGEGELMPATVATYSRAFLEERAERTERMIARGEIVDALVDLWVMSKRGRGEVSTDVVVKLLQEFSGEFDEQFVKELRGRGFPI